MNSKFKPGDRVRCIRDSGDGGYEEGKVYTVSKVYHYHIRTEVDSLGSTTNGWGSHNFEPVAAEPKERKRMKGE